MEQKTIKDLVCGEYCILWNNTMEHGKSMLKTTKTNA